MRQRTDAPSARRQTPPPGPFGAGWETAMTFQDELVARTIAEWVRFGRDEGESA